MPKSYPEVPRLDWANGDPKYLAGGGPEALQIEGAV